MLKVALLQKEIAWGDPVKNRESFSNTISRCGRADLYILPEMFSTGFCSKSQFFAEPSGNSSLGWMKECALRFNAAIAGSIAIDEGGACYNRFYFVKPNGETVFYDKRHLFTYGGEDRRFTAGRERVVVEFRGVRILLQVCYDLRFPVWARNRKDYDMILYVASWPTPRVEAWLALLRARAIENQCYVAGVNRVGTDPACEYCGGTLMIDPYGQTLAECERERVCAVTAEVDMEHLESFRRKFPVLDDADDFTLNI